MNRETQMYASEADVRERKPVMEQLVRDMRKAVEALPSCGRREQLENLVVYFGASLSNPREDDVTQAEADAFRETWWP